MYRDNNLPSKLKTPGSLYIFLCTLIRLFFALNMLYIEAGISAVVYPMLPQPRLKKKKQTLSVSLKFLNFRNGQ